MKYVTTLLRNLDNTDIAHTKKMSDTSSLNSLEIGSTKSKKRSKKLKIGTSQNFGSTNFLAENELELEQDEHHRQKMARDLAELQQMITTHFVQRQKDDEELAELEVRIEKRQIERARQVKLRQDREKERVQRENEAKIKKEQEILKKKKEEEEARIKIINNISMNKMDYLGRYGKSKGNRKQTEREKKKKILGDRRKALNIDHLTKIKLIEKARELHAWMAHLGKALGDV